MDQLELVRTAHGTSALFNSASFSASNPAVALNTSQITTTVHDNIHTFWQPQPEAGLKYRVKCKPNKYACSKINYT